MSQIRVVKRQDLDAGTAQTPGMSRAAAISAPTCGASSIWMGRVTTEPGFRSGAHHHGDVESAIYVLSGRLRMRWGEHLEQHADAEAGDYIFVPAQLVHQEMNLSSSEGLVAVLARGGQENVVVNVELPEASDG